jgi:hypothetical protein
MVLYKEKHNKGLTIVNILKSMRMHNESVQQYLSYHRKK